MDVITKYLNNIAYKFPKGYPDMDDPKDKAMLFEIIEQQMSLFSDDELDAITIKVKKETGVNLEKVSSDVRQDILDIVGDDAKLSDDDLEKVKSYIGGIKYKKEIIDYISSKGAGASAVSTPIFNKMVETGEVVKYADYLKNMYNFSSLGNSGNYFSKFGMFSKDLIFFILSQTPSVRRIGTGKGEILMQVMLGDVKDATSGGDIDVDGKEVEVKGKGAIPMGQKAEFSENTIIKIYDEIEEEINNILNDDITLRIKGTRPFNRFGVVFDQIKETQPNALKNYISALNSSLRRNYKGVDFSSFNIASYVKGGEFDWIGLELDIAKRIIELYTQLEGFEEVVFLDGVNGNYTIIPTNELVSKAGKEIEIKFADGMPRWTYKF